MREKSLRQQPREFRPIHKILYTVHEREQTYKHRSSDKSYGTTGRQQSQPGATAKGHGPSYESYSRTTQDQRGHHLGIRMTTQHHQP